MAITNGYATLSDVKDRLDIDVTAHDLELESVIEAASRWLDNATHRTFYATASADRYFSTGFTDECWIDDAVTVTAVATDNDNDRTYGTSWASTDWEEDDNAPINTLYTTPNGTQSFPTTRRAIKVTGTWGYAATAPKDIEEACILLSMRLWKRKDAIFGIAGAPALGVQVVQAHIGHDADIMTLIKPYIRYEVYA